MDTKKHNGVSVVDVIARPPRQLEFQKMQTHKTACPGQEAASKGAIAKPPSRESLVDQQEARRGRGSNPYAETQWHKQTEQRRALQALSSIYQQKANKV